jgi:hypothetical protein
MKSGFELTAQPLYFALTREFNGNQQHNYGYSEFVNSTADGTHRTGK